tara:strand:+ start:419 stop:655 length:237 start_codon:yes stop_codon:yes gene_type:complete
MFWLILIKKDDKWEHQQICGYQTAMAIKYAANHPEGSINLLSIDHSIHAPFDPQTGQKTSPRAHAPFSITKPIDLDFG